MKQKLPIILSRLKMQIYKSKSGNLASILNADLFVMLGLQELSEPEKEKFQTKVEQLILQYFIQEKIGDVLSEKEMEELMKMPTDNEEQSMKFLEKVGEMVPDASDLYVEAAMEVKAKLVEDQYRVKHSDLEKMLKVEKDDQKKKLLEKDIKNCEENLAHVEKGEWGLINQIDLQDQV